MGQGYSMTTPPAASATIDVPELADLTHEKTLASGRFMKSIRARSSQGFVFVKAVMKPYASFDVRSYVKQITEERNALASIPNALGYQRIVEIGSGGFLVRQYIFSSVYDRLSTRPFLEDIEKRWLAFQLLSAVRDCHALGIYHGDIKTENLLVTSWNWLYLSDFSASFKPTNLPEDNPADFSFYFDTSSRRICYVAPERFTSGTTDGSPNELNWAMDMFSVGCAIAEIFLEGPIFTLSQIFKYRNGDYSPEHTHLNKIEDVEVRAMLLNMIEIDPEKRYSAEQHLAFYRDRLFPEYFYSFLHDYMQDLTESIADRKPVSLESETLKESDNKIDRVYQDFDKISYLLGYGSGVVSKTHRQSLRRKSIPTSGPTDTDLPLPDGTLLFLTLVSSGIRNTSKTSARLRACDLLVSFAERIPDEAKLDRVLPYLAGMLNDPSDTVKVAALEAMTKLLSLVEVVSPINAYLFPEYIFPNLRQFLPGSGGQPSALVRAAYASCLASLAFSSARMLDMVQAIRADGRLPAFSNDAWAPETSYHGLYDVARAELVPHFEEATTMLITDSEPSVRRALLGSVSRLCVFFGSTKASDVILSHLNTYLNDKDWILRCAFYDVLVGIASYVGTSSLEQFILPVMVGSLTDTESFVVEKVIRSLSRMAALGLFQKSAIWELSSVITRYLVHPSLWIREAACQFVEHSSKYLSTADKFCIMLPILQPYLKTPVAKFDEETLLNHLKAPLSRPVLDGAIIWAAKKERSLFWTAASRDGVFTLSNLDGAINSTALAKRLPNRIPPSQKDKDDLISLDSLRNFGMSADDEVKLLALREYILRLATNRTDDTTSTRQSMLNDIVSFAQIEVTPQNVFFDPMQPFRETKSRPRSKLRSIETENSRSLAEALLDASTTINGNFPTNSTQAGEMLDTNEPPLAKPVDIRGTSRTPSSDAAGSGKERRSDRQNLVIDSLKSENARRSSSVGARHALLDPERLSVSRRGTVELKHQSSAVSLMQRSDSMKADAEISTTPENAFGKLDGILQKRPPNNLSTLSKSLDTEVKHQSPSSVSRNSSVPPYEANHSYSGGDRNVIRLLDNHLAENFPVDLIDFGPSRQPADTATPIKRATDLNVQLTSQQSSEKGKFHKEPWRPAGQLLTQFAEHTAAITRVVAAPDHAFFITGSDDGTVKIWDTTRLEKNITSRSRHTYRHATGTRITSLCFVENTHTFISAASDGSIHAVRVVFKVTEGGEGTRYGKPVLVRDYQIPQFLEPASDVADEHASHEHAVWLHHYRTQNSQSILLAATNKYRILMFDIKNMELLHIMTSPPQYGALTTFCIDRRQHWLLLGTSHGILGLWDLRFRLSLRNFGIGGAGLGKRVDRLQLHPSKGHGRWVIASCGGELSVWDVEKMTCREVLRPSTFIQHIRKDVKSYEAWYPDDDSGRKILQSFAKSLVANEDMLTPPMRTGADSESSLDKLSSPQGKRDSLDLKRSPPSIPALFVLNDYLLNTAQPDNPNKSTIMFSAGDDRTIRYWDLAHIDQSFIVSGPMINVVGDANRVKARYETSWPTSMSLSGLVQLVEEKLGESSHAEDRDAANNARGTPKKRKAGGQETRKGTIDEPGAGNTGAKTPRNTVISAAQQQLLKTHMEGITDMCVLRRPYGCVITVDRGGSVYVFH